MRTVFNILVKPFGVREKISDGRLVQQRVLQNTEDIERAPLEFAVVLDDSDQTVRRDCRIYLDSYGILGVAPEGLNPEMTLYPAKEQFNLPSLLIEQGDVFGLELEVVGQERERPFEARSVVHYSPQFSRILFLGLIAGEAYRLVQENVIISIQKFLSINHFVVETRLLSDDEVRSDCRYRVQPYKVIIPLVKDVERIRLVRNLIHRSDIMDFSLRDVYVNRYLGDNIIQRVNLDTAFSLSEASSLVKTQAEVDCSGVESVELAVKHELPINSLALRKVYHQPDTTRSKL